MKSVAVFCGSSNSNKPIYAEQAYQLGCTLAEQSIRLVYGGAKIGLMGEVAKGALENSGQVVGVIPKFLKHKEVAHDGLTELLTVDTMHQRKTKMDELSEGVIALPGGFGTMEEFFEMLTWGQLGLHTKPIGLLNTDGFYDPLATLFERMHQDGLLKEVNLKMVLVSSNSKDLLRQMANYTPPVVDKWISHGKT